MEIPIEKRILSSLRQYPEVTTEGLVLSPAEKKLKRLPKGCFHIQKQKCSLDLKGLTGKAHSKPTWPTFSPQGFYTLATDLAILRHCHQTNAWAEAKWCWLSSFLAPGMVFRAKPSEAWLFSLGHVSYSCVLCIPVALSADGIHVAIAQLRDASSFLLQCVFDENQVEVLPTAWVAPLEHALAGQGPNSCCHISLVRTGSAIPLLEASARVCFKDPGIGVLRDLCKRQGLESSGSLWDVLVRLLDAIMGAGFSATPEGIATLELRVHEPPPGFAGLLDSSALEEALPKDALESWEAGV